MALNNANLLQDNIDLSIDLNILKNANNKYLLDALANLGQRIGVSGDSITISNLSLENWLSTASTDVYLSIQYNDSKELVLKWYDPETKEYTDIDDGLPTYTYNKLTYDNMNSILETYNGIINDVINFNEKSYANIKDNYLYSYLFTETIRDTTHYMYEVVKYNLNTSTIDEYNRLLYLGNDDDNINIYLYVTLINKTLNIYIFNDIYIDNTAPDDILKKEYIDSKVDVSELIDLINTYINNYISSEKNIIFSSKDNGEIQLRVDTEYNINYIIDESYDNYINEIYSKYLEDYDVKIHDIIQYVNNYISYLCPDIVKTISYKLYTQSIKVFTKQILLNLYEAVVDSVNADKKYYGILYLPYDLVISYISKEANIMYPFSSIDIPVYFVSDEVTDYDSKIIFKYLISNDDYDITNKIKIFKFYCKYNEYNGVLYSVYFINTIMPYIGSNHLWYVNDKQTDVLASYDNNNSINICVVEYDLDSSFSSITNIEDIQVHHNTINIVNTDTNIYSTYLYKHNDEDGIYMQIPIVSINMHSTNENIMFIGKANIQTASPYSIYFIYVCSHINGEIYKISPLVNGNNVLVTINDLINYTDSNITLLKNNIEELGFSSKVYIKNSLNIEKDSNSIKIYNNTEDTTINTAESERVQHTYLNTFTNYITTETDTTLQYNSSDNTDTVTTGYLPNTLSSSGYNNFVNLEWKINNHLMEISNIIYDNLKAQNKLQVVSFDQTDTYLDYLGHNIVKGYGNETVLTAVEPAEYNTTIFGSGLKEISGRHDALRLKYDDIVLDAKVYTGDLDLGKRYYRSTNYYTSKYNMAGNIDFYMPISYNTRFKNNNQTPQELLSKLFAAQEVKQVRGNAANITNAEFLYVYNYRSMESGDTQTVHVFMNVTKLYKFYSISTIQNIIINGHYYNKSFNYFLNDGYVKEKYVEITGASTVKYIYLGEYKAEELSKIGLPYVAVKHLDNANETDTMSDTDYNKLTTMYFNSNVKITFTKYDTRSDNANEEVYDIYFDFDDNE